MSSNRPLIFCEFEAKGLDQCEVNAAFLATAREAFPDSDIHFLAEKSHLALVKQRLREHAVPNIDFHRISVLPIHGKIYAIIRELYLCAKLFFYSKKLNAQRLILCSLRQRRVRWANLIAARLSDAEVIAIMHHTHDCLGLPPRLSWLNRFVFPTQTPKNLRYLVLGRSIAYHTQIAFPRLASSIRWMHHPYFFPNHYQPKPLNGQSICFCFYGMAKRKKGAHHFRDLAKMVKRSELGSRARFLFLGFYWKDAVQMHQNQEIEVPENTLPQNSGELTRAEIKELSTTVNYAIFPYEQKEYTYRSSGTLFDAIAYGIPIIALTNPLFEAYFEDLGDIGYLCDSVAEIQKTVMDILKNQPAERYLRQQACLEQARDKLQISNLAEDFKTLPFLC